MPARVLSRGVAAGVALVLAVAAPASLARAQEVATLKPQGVSPANCVAFSPDGKAVVLGGSFGAVAVWDVAKKIERYTLAGNKEEVAAVSFSPDGKYVLAGTWGYVVKVWDTAGKEGQKDVTGHGSWGTGLAFRPDGT